MFCETNGRGICAYAINGQLSVSILPSLKQAVFVGKCYFWIATLKNLNFPRCRQNQGRGRLCNHLLEVYPDDLEESPYFTCKKCYSDRCGKCGGAKCTPSACSGSARVRVGCPRVRATRAESRRFRILYIAAEDGTGARSSSTP